jgi:hypothetical protein
VTSRERLLATFDALAAVHAQGTGHRVELRQFGGPGLTVREFRPGG